MKATPKMIEVPAELLINFDALLGEMSRMHTAIESLLLSKDKKFMAKLKQAEEDVAQGKIQDWDEFLSGLNGQLSNKDN